MNAVSAIKPDPLDPEPGDPDPGDPGAAGLGRPDSGGDDRDPVFLGIDTATPYLALALWSPRRGVLARRAPRVERDHAARIVAELERLFSAAGLPRPAAAPSAAPPAPDAAPGPAAGPIAGIVVGTGPGSYTGLRVGAATARGLARAWGVALEGGDTLAALAATALRSGPSRAERSVWGVIDARRGNVYAGCYRLENDRIDTLEPPAKLARTDLPAGADVVEGIAPDAAELARTFGRGGAPAPRYL